MARCSCEWASGISCCYLADLGSGWPTRSQWVRSSSRRRTSASRQPALECLGYQAHLVIDMRRRAVVGTASSRSNLSLWNGSQVETLP